MARSLSGLEDPHHQSDVWPDKLEPKIDHRREHLETLEKLRQDVVGSAIDTRRAFFIFGAFSLYLIITVGSTTHLQLLTGTVFKLPILSVDIPILGFYVALPLLYMLAHFNLLGELNALSDDIGRLKHHLKTFDLKLEAPIPFGPARALIQPDDSGVPHVLINLVTFFAVVIMPPLILLMVQIRFLPYHSEWATWWHRGLIILDVVLVVGLWFALQRHDAAGVQAADGDRPNDRSRWHTWPKTKLSHFKRAYRKSPDPGVCTLIFPVILCASIFLVTVPDGNMERWALQLLRSLGTVEIGGGQSAQPQRSDPEAQTDGSLASDRPQRTYHGMTPAPRRMLALTYHLFEAPHSLRWLRRNLVVTHTDLVPKRPRDDVLFLLNDGRDPKEVWDQGSRGLDLRGRDLRYADFSHSELHKADLRGANLEGAILIYTKLPYADLGDLDVAKLRRCASDDLTHTIYKPRLGADFCRTNLRYVTLQNAELQHVRFWEADLRGANLKWAKLRHADLNHADLRDATLRGAELQGAELDQTHASRADFSDAKFEGTKISHQSRCRAMWSGARFLGDGAFDYKSTVAAATSDKPAIKGSVYQCISFFDQ